jgi:hypothetical protein
MQIFFSMVLFVDVEMKQPRGSEGKKGRERLSKRASGNTQWEIPRRMFGDVVIVRENYEDEEQRGKLTSDHQML